MSGPAGANARRCAIPGCDMTVFADVRCRGHGGSPWFEVREDDEWGQPLANDAAPYRNDSLQGRGEVPPLAAAPPRRQHD